MRHLKTEILIAATPEKIWQVLTNFEGFSNWNPFIKSIKGEQEVGKKLEVNIQPPENKPMTFTPKILVFEPAKELRWIGNGPIPGLFSGEHSFVLEDQKDGNTKVFHQELFKGILVGFMSKMLDNTEIGFEQMNEALKAECEK